MADIKELMQVRRDKMQKLIDNGVNVHPERYERTHQIKEARELPDGTKDVSIAGRVMSKRKLGKISFLDLRDLEGFHWSKRRNIYNSSRRKITSSL